LTRDTSSNIKTIPDRHNKRPVWKKFFRVGDAMVAIIDESIVELMQIDEDCWLQEIPTSEGILLKISRCSESPEVPNR
jgi:hypothetical protein